MQTRFSIYLSIVATHAAAQQHMDVRLQSNVTSVNCPSEQSNSSLTQLSFLALGDWGIGGRSQTVWSQGFVDNWDESSSNSSQVADITDDTSSVSVQREGGGQGGE